MPCLVGNVRLGAFKNFNHLLDPCTTAFTFFLGLASLPHRYEV